MSTEAKTEGLELKLCLLFISCCTLLAVKLVKHLLRHFEVFFLPLQVIVELRVVFLKIGEIDTLKEQYSADTFIQAKWREPGLDGRTTEVSIQTRIRAPFS